MKTIIRKGAVIAAAVLLTSNIHTFAIEGLQLSLQCSNVVLSWPSIGGQNYIIQYRPTLDPSTPWRTLTNSYPGDWTTNVTVFVHSNIVQNPVCGGGDFFAAMAEDDGETSSTKLDFFDWGVPLTTRADGTGSIVPLALYPPGFDLSDFLIFDPATSDWLKGTGFIREDVITMDGPPNPEEGGGTDGGTNSPPETGFYQVVQDGVQILASTVTNLTNGVLSGTVSIGFEAGNADWSNGTNLIGTLSGAILLVDGVKYMGEGVLSSPPWNFDMDTAYLENGEHWIQVEAFWYDPNADEDGTEGLYPSRYSDAIMITVSNAIYYPQWEEDIGEAATNSAYFLKTTCTNADWFIDIYDVGSNFVQRLSGHTDDGIIEAYWNMVDTNGVARTNADVDPEFSAIVTVADPITKPTPKKKMPKSDWPEHGRWTVAFQNYFKHYYSADGDMQGHINSFALTAQKYGGYYLYYPPAGSTNDIGQTYPLRYRNSKHPEDGVTAEMITKDYNYLKTFIGSTNSRNFFYRGHGNPWSIGDITSSAIKSVVGKKRYRFVLLQACESADGDLDKAFGINGPGQFDVPYYQKSGKRPAAFVGNHGKSYFCNAVPVNIGGVNYDGTIPWQAPYLYYNFLFYWDYDLMGYTLYYALGNAIDDLPAITGWSYDKQPGRALKVYGYIDLGIDEFNYRTSWP